MASKRGQFVIGYAGMSGVVWGEDTPNGAGRAVDTLSYDQAVEDAKALRSNSARVVYKLVPVRRLPSPYARKAGKG